MISPSAVSSALIREEKGKERPVYCTCQELKGAEERYPEMEKLAFALVVAARKLRPYFQADTVQVLIDQPTEKLLKSPDLSGRLINWSVECHIEYFPRIALLGVINSSSWWKRGVKKYSISGWPC